MAKVIQNALNIVVTGKGSQARKLAFLDIAPNAFAEGMSRNALVIALSTALGRAPSKGDIDVAKREYVIGRVAARMADKELTGFTSDNVARMERCRTIVERFAQPVKDGVKARPLRKGQEGRRTIGQHKAIRAAEEAFSQLLAETGVGNAKTQDERNAAKRAPAMKGTTARGNAPAPTHSELVRPASATTADEACQHVVGQAASLLAFCNKNAKLISTDIGSAVRAFKAAVDKADAERRVNA